MADDYDSSESRAGPVHKLAAPTAEYLNSLSTELEDLYRQDDIRIGEMRAQREMRVPAMNGADSKYQLVSVDPRDPDIAEEAFQQLAIMTLERPTLRVKAGESDTAQTNATLREHWTTGVLWTCGTREPGTDTMAALTDACLNDGGAWAKLLWAPDCWDRRYQLKAPDEKSSSADYDEYDKATEEAKKDAGPPFAWISVDPRTIYPVWSQGKLVEVVEVTERPLRATLRRYRLSLDAGGNIVPEELGQPASTAMAGRTIPTSVTMLEHWDEEWCTWMLTGTNYHGTPTGAIVKQFRHGYPFGVPYDFAPGLWMNHWTNRKAGWGISQTKLWLVQYRQYLRAMHAQYVARDLLSPLVTYGESTAAPVIGDDGKPRDRDPGPIPGEVINLPSGRQMQRIDYPDATTLEKHMALVDAAIQQLESPRVTELGGLEGAGFAISQVLSYSKTRVGPISNGLSRLLRGQTEKLWCLVREKAKETVYVASDSEHAKSGYLGLKPEDFERAAGIEWTVQQVLPTDDMIKARYAHERLAAGTWGADEAVDYLGDNPDEIRRSKLRDEVRQSPQYKKWALGQIFLFAGRGDILGEAAEAEQLALQSPGLEPGLAPGAAQPGPPQPGVFEGGGPGMGGVPDLGALAAAPNGAGVAPPQYGQVMAGAQQAMGGPPM